MTDPHTPAPSTASGAGLSELERDMRGYFRLHGAPLPETIHNWADRISASRMSATTGWEDITRAEVREEWARLCKLHEGDRQYRMDRVANTIKCCNAIFRRRLAGEQATGGAGPANAWTAGGHWYGPFGTKQAAEAAARAHPAPAPSAPGAGGGLTEEGTEVFPHDFQLHDKSGIWICTACAAPRTWETTLGERTHCIVGAVSAGAAGSAPQT